jgi:hypothetical protein
MKPPSKASETASAFLAAARAEGFQVIVKNPSVVTIFKKFPKGDKDAFVSCDMMAPGLLDMLGAKGGSMWGTDGGSIGGASALLQGAYSLNVSGVPKRVSASLAKSLA